MIVLFLSNFTTIDEPLNIRVQDLARDAQVLKFVQVILFGLPEESTESSSDVGGDDYTLIVTTAIGGVLLLILLVSLIVIAVLGARYLSRRQKKS